MSIIKSYKELLQLIKYQTSFLNEDMFYLGYEEINANGDLDTWEITVTFLPGTIFVEVKYNNEDLHEMEFTYDQPSAFFTFIDCYGPNDTETKGDVN